MKLQGKIVFVIVSAIVASMLLLAVVVFTQLRQRSELELFSQMQLLLDQTQQHTQSYLDNVVANTKLFSGSNLMDNYVIIEDESDRYELMQPALLRLFTKYQKAYPEYREIRLILPDGYEDTRIALPGLLNKTEEEYTTPYFQAMLNSDLDSMTAIIENADDGATTLIVSVPIYRKDLIVTAIAAKPILRGFMVVTANLDFLEKQIKKQKIGNDGYLIAIDKKRRIVFHPQESMIGKDASTLSQAVMEIQNRSNEQGIRSNTALVSYQNESVFVRGQRLHPDLTVLSVLPTTEFKAMSQKLAMTVVLISMIAIILSSILLIFMMRNLVVEPVRKISHLAIAIGEGRTVEVQDSSLDRNDEIGDLARAFKDMNSKLHVSLQQLQLSHAEIEKLAYRDSLTGLPNRRLFLELVEHAINDSKRKNRHFALLYLDLDDFKKINDTLGHLAGDVLLKEVAVRLRECLRATDVTMRGDVDTQCTTDSQTVARLGGDEFIVLLNELRDPMDAGYAAERILEAMRKPVLLSGQKFVIESSIGIASYPDNGNDVETLIECADAAMYEVKQREKNSYIFYSVSMRQAIQERLSLERDLRIAVEEKSLHLFFQPQFNTQTEKLIGTEVLLRWQHPERGNVRPDQFISIAEDTGLIGVLGEWIIDEACKQWAQWNELGIAPARLAVNVSQRQFKLSKLVEVIYEALAIHNMPANAFEVEITESCMMDASSDVVQSLNEIRKKGVRIAMDDFGTGYSSLGVLTSLPIDTLKIDRSFVTGVERGKPSEKIVSAILSLAHNLNLEVVGEGVETRSEHQYLLEMGCEICQGYLFSRPLSAAQMTEMLVREYSADQDDFHKKTG